MIAVYIENHTEPYTQNAELRDCYNGCYIQLPVGFKMLTGDGTFKSMQSLSR
jgi:hypothetical protein